MSEEGRFKKSSFFLFLLDSICDLMGCAMAKGILQRIGENIAEKLIKKFSVETLNVKSMEELKNTQNPLTYFDDTLVAAEEKLFILEKCPFLEILIAYKEISSTLPVTLSQITEIYNDEDFGYAVSPFCILHQTFRKEIAEHIKVNGKDCELFHLGCKSTSGAIKFASQNIEDLSLTEKEVENMLENKACSYLLQTKD